MGLRACEIAGIKPWFERLTDQDPAAFIVSANLNRRNMTSGQRAMALAMIYPNPEKGGRGKTLNLVKGLGKTVNAGLARLSQARTVFDHSEALAKQVLAGSIPLNDALLRVRQAQNKIKEVVDEVQTEEQREAEEANRKSAELRSKAPDLADLVADEKMPLNEAHAAMQERERQYEISGRSA